MDGGHVWSRVPTFGSDGSPSGGDRILNNIMLRFRPIAPKPVAGSSASTAGDASVLQGKRTKRKYVRIRRNSGYVRKNGNNNKSSEKSAEKKDELENMAVVTLQLLPEKDAPENENPSPAAESWCNNVDLDLTVEKIQILEDPEPPRVAAAAKAVESWVTVESVTGTCMGGEGGGGGGLGCTDVEKVKSLETDTCPGFVSDGCCRVRWVNEAFKRMVESEEIVVWLKVKEEVIAWCYSHPAFTCGVRLQYTWRNEKCTKMVPCDVWRLGCGGFAWRLDVKTALSLGL